VKIIKSALDLAVSVVAIIVYIPFILVVALAAAIMDSND
jgi:hypothetical protein